MSRRQRAWQHEHGFTLIEVIVTIVIMGIVLGIASSTWFGVVESRRVDSATNQVVSEMHLAHTRATNRLENWEVDLRAPGDPANAYRIGPCADPCGTPLPPPSRSLEDDDDDDVRTQFSAGMSGVRIVFKPNGEAEINGLAGPIQVAAEDGSPCHEIEVNSLTSRTKVVTGYNNVC